MDLNQTDHLKAYGIAYWSLEQGIKFEWLLNYRGGSFMSRYDESIARRCRILGVFYEKLDGSATAGIYHTIERENMEVIRLEKAPSIAVYAPPNAQPWDDAVTLVLTYADISYTTVWMKKFWTVN